MRKYRLFYGDIEFGEITQEDADFPNLIGTFQPGGTGGGELRERLERYVAYCVAADRAMMEGGEAAWEKYVQENESEFVDLIETEDWHVLDLRDGGPQEPILVPTFYEDHGIVWRLNVLGPGGSGSATGS